MRMIGWLIGVILLTAACDNKNTRPSTVLQPSVFTAVLVDIHLAEAEAMGKDLKNDTVVATLHAQYRRIWQQHNVDSSQFFSSMEWYRQHPNEMHAVYERVHEKLLLEQEQIIAQ